MTYVNLRKLVNKSNELSANNCWDREAFDVNMKIWNADNNNFNACTRLAKYYELNGNIADARMMYLNAIKIPPYNYDVKKRFN